MFKGFSSDRSPQGPQKERTRVPLSQNGEAPEEIPETEENGVMSFEEVLAQWKRQLNNDSSLEKLDGEVSPELEEILSGEYSDTEPEIIPADTGSPKKPGSTLTVSDVMGILRQKRGQNGPKKTLRVLPLVQKFSEPAEYTPVNTFDAMTVLSRETRHGVRRLFRKIRGADTKDKPEESSELTSEEEELLWDEERRSRVEEEKKAKSIRKRVRKGIRNALITLMILASLMGIGYGLFVFSDIPFFVKWRTLYIETAMSTLNHQWLATSFIPQSIIDDVMQTAEKANEDQKRVQTNWNDREEQKEKNVPLDKETFYDRYWELNEDFFEDWLDQHPDARAMGYENLVIDNLDCEDTTLHTRYGEIIRALNVPENVLIVQVKGTDYVGTLATVKDPGQVIMKKAQDFGNEGDLIETFCKDEVLAINGSGFLDEGGLSNGSTVVGSFVMNGVDYGTPDYNYLFFGMQRDNRLHIQWGVSETEKYRWAFQFSPALIINGKTVVEGSYGWGLQPRSAIGQTKNGDFLMLIIDGRQVGYSIGCLVEDCAKILKKHRAYQAVNMDGGSSSIMAYQGKIITKNSSKSVNGREIPNSIVVTHANTGTGQRERTDRSGENTDEPEETDSEEQDE